MRRDDSTLFMMTADITSIVASASAAYPALSALQVTVCRSPVTILDMIRQDQATFAKYAVNRSNAHLF